MWASVALMTTLNLAPMPVSQLKLTNDRVTHGVLGWERKDSKNPKLYPGDVFLLMFDIENLAISPTGLVKYGMGMELLDKDNKTVFRQDPGEKEVNLTLGGKRLWATVQTEVGLGTPIGKYTVKVTVKDLDSKAGAGAKEATLTRVFEVIPTDLGFIRVGVTYPGVRGEVGAPAPPVAVPGQMYIVSFSTVGFTLDPKLKQPSITVEMRILDETGKPVLEKPATGAALQVDPLGQAAFYPWSLPAILNRPGRFKMVLKVTDTLTKKSAEETLEFVVIEPK